MRRAVLALFLLCACREAPKDTGIGESAPPLEDADDDGFASDVDCDDANAAVHPDAEETCDGIDNDCDGLTDDADDAVTGTTSWFEDADSDGYGNSASSRDACEAPERHVPDDTDCNDLNPDYHPGAEESDCTDPEDYNCDGSVGYADEDGDGFAACEECDDTVASSNPLAFEVCDGADNDCDGTTDEDDAVDTRTWYEDSDGDGYGDALYTVNTCDMPTGYVADDTDCDDNAGTVHEGAAETCDDIDNDCDGWVDDTDPDVTGTTTWYGDSDGDGHGGQQYQQEACENPAGFVANSDDCDDLAPTSHPGAVETCDLSDNDCDGAVDEGVQLTWYADSDADGFGDASSSMDACTQPPGYQSNGNDCNDVDAAAHPGGVEICDGVDNDCDGTTDLDALDGSTWYADGDGDGYGDATSPSNACTQPSQTSSNSTDCNDADGTIHPAASEACDNIDNNCDGAIDEGGAAAATWYTDGDTDGYGDPDNFTVACNAPSGTTSDNTDCNDQDSAIHPNATEQWYDGVDTDCDGADDFDADGDGYSSFSVNGGEDCDDADANVWTCGSTSAVAAASCAEILASDSTLADGVYWLDPDSQGAYEVFCDMTHDGGGWALLAKFSAAGTGWGWSESNWTSASPLNSADTLDATTVADAKNDSWSRLAVTKMRLDTVGATSANGPYVIWPLGSSTAFDLWSGGTQLFTPTAGDMTSFSKADSNFQGNAGEGSNTLLINASTSHASDYACCALNNRVRLGTSCYQDFSSYPHGAANSGYKGVGGTTRYRDGHNASCCNYGEQSEVYSNTSGDNLVLWGR